MSNLDVWYSSLPVEQAFQEFTRDVDPKRLKKAEANVAKARTKDSMHAFEKLTHVVDGERRIISEPPLIVPIEELIPATTQRHEIVSEIQVLIRSYRQTLETDRRHLLEQFRFVDMARKVVGVGSVGTRAWIVLFMGVDFDDPLFLQVKEAQPSVLEQFVGKSEYKNSGKRVVAGQRLMQANTDIFLGWQHVSSALDGKERDFYVRQLKDWKGSFEFEAALPAGAGAYGKACGWTLARAHARSGDTIAIASYLGKSDTFDRAVADFAETMPIKTSATTTRYRRPSTRARSGRNRPLTGRHRRARSAGSTATIARTRRAAVPGRKRRRPRATGDHRAPERRLRAAPPPLLSFTDQALARLRPRPGLGLAQAGFRFENRPGDCVRVQAPPTPAPGWSPDGRLMAWRGSTSGVQSSFSFSRARRDASRSRPRGRGADRAPAPSRQAREAARRRRRPLARRCDAAGRRAAERVLARVGDPRDDVLVLGSPRPSHAKRAALSSRMSRRARR
jgi:hypothetical protein